MSAFPPDYLEQSLEDDAPRDLPERPLPPEVILDESLSITARLFRDGSLELHEIDNANGSILLSAEALVKLGIYLEHWK